MEFVRIGVNSLEKGEPEIILLDQVFLFVSKRNVPDGITSIFV